MFKHFPFLKYQINMKENRDNSYPQAFASVYVSPFFFTRNRVMSDPCFVARERRLA